MWYTLKKGKLIFILFISCWLTACQHIDYKYAKNIFFTGEAEAFKVCIEYYDFSGESENFETIIATDDNLKSICIDMCKRENINFRLCENVYISQLLLESYTEDLFDTITSVQIPLAVNLWCFNGENMPDGINEETIKTKLYNFLMPENKIEGILSVFDNVQGYKGAVVLSEGKIVRNLDDIQWNILSVLVGDTDSISLQITDENIYARLNNCSVYFSGRKELILNFTAVLADFKGISESVMNENMLRQKLEKQIKNTLHQLYNDTVMVEVCSLYWYENQCPIDIRDVNIKVTIL